MFSAISFLYDPLSRSRMCSVCASERELQFLHRLCWILFVLFHWILCISPVSIHELTRLHSLVVLWSTTLKSPCHGCYIWYGKLRSFGWFVDSIEFQFNDGTRGDRGEAFDIRYGHCRILPYDKAQYLLPTGMLIAHFVRRAEETRRAHTFRRM